MKNIKRRNKYSHAAKRFFCAFTAFCFCASVFCACKKPSSSIESVPPVNEETSEPPKPEFSGKVRIAMPENLSVDNARYDPLIVRTEEELELYSLVYEPLIKIDETSRLIPCLAVKWSRTAERSWTLTLRDGVRFHSGAELTADDVVYTFRLLHDKGEKSHYARSLDQIRSITKKDANTVIVNTRSKGITALYALCFPILQSGARPFNGTGAYRVNEYGDDKISMQANDDWWDRPPYIEQIEFLPRDSNDTALHSYIAGQLDIVPTALLSAGKYNEPGITAVHNYMTQGMETLLFNHSRELCAKPEFRKAVAHSINRSRLITNVYMNKARSCDVPIPPDSWLYDANAAQIDYNLHTAAHYIDAAGCTRAEDGSLFYNDAPIELTLLVSSTVENTTRLEAANAIAAQLLEVGIKVDVVTAAHGFGEKESEFMQALALGEWDIALIGFNLNISNDLSPYLTSDGKCNYGSVSGALLGEQLDEIASSEDEGALRIAFSEMQRAFIEHLPFVVLYFRLNSLVCSEKLNGITEIREPDLFRNIKNWYIASDKNK